MPTLTFNQITEAYNQEGATLETQGISYYDLRIEEARGIMKKTIQPGSCPMTMVDSFQSFLIALLARDITNMILEARRGKNTQTIAGFPEIKDMFFHGALPNIIRAMN